MSAPAANTATFYNRFDGLALTAERSRGGRNPWPDFLQVLLARLTVRLGLKRGDFVQALINEYAHGTGIG